jgi:hypothetical protein
VRWINHQPSSRRTLPQPGTAALRFGCGFAALCLCGFKISSAFAIRAIKSVSIRVHPWLKILRCRRFFGQIFQNSICGFQLTNNFFFACLPRPV